MEFVSKINVFRGRRTRSEVKNQILTGTWGAGVKISALFLYNPHAVGLKNSPRRFLCHPSENCIKRGWKFLILFSLAGESQGAWVCSHAP